MLTHLRHGTTPGFASIARAATGRSLIDLLIARAAPTAVLLPRYVPEGVIYPFEINSIPVAFYGLDKGLRPDPDEINQLLSDRIGPVMVVVIHYFGYPTATGPIALAVNRHGGYLLEDCAQALLGPVSSARAADFALYSINKWLPVMDGAILKSRRVDVDVSIVLEPEWLPVSARYAYLKHLDANTVFAARGSVEALNDSRAAYEEYYQSAGHLLGPRRPWAESRRAEDTADFAMIADLHRLHAGYLAARLNGFIFRSVGSAVPWGLPILVDPAKRDDLAKSLFDHGIHAMTQIDRWAANVLPGTPERDFVDRHLLLPIGVDAKLDDLNTMLKLIRKYG